MTATALETYAQNANHNHMLAKRSLFEEPPLQLLSNQANAKTLIGEALHQRVEAVDHELCNAGDEDTFYVADLGEIYRQHLRWKKNLPRVKPFYGTQRQSKMMSFFKAFYG